MLIIFTGNGKGKTTAALGQALRAVGAGKRVLMVQFIKGPWHSGEDVSAKRLSPQFKLVKKGKGFVGIGGDRLPRKVHAAAALAGMAYAEKQALTKKWDMLILDEIWNAHHLKLISAAEIWNCIQKALPCVDHLIMTGRDCPQRFIRMADLVTEMKEIKHPFNKKQPGTKGLEF